MTWALTALRRAEGVHSAELLVRRGGRTVDHGGRADEVQRLGRLRGLLQA